MQLFDLGGVREWCENLIAGRHLLKTPNPAVTALALGSKSLISFSMRAMTRPHKVTEATLSEPAFEAAELPSAGKLNQGG